MCCFPLVLRNGHKEQDLMLCQDVGSADIYWLSTHQEASLETEKAWIKRKPFQLPSWSFLIITRRSIYVRLDIHSKCIHWPRYWGSILLNTCDAKLRATHNSFYILRHVNYYRDRNIRLSISAADIFFLFQVGTVLSINMLPLNSCMDRIFFGGKIQLCRFIFYSTYVGQFQLASCF